MARVLDSIDIEQTAACRFVADAETTRPLPL
jgi:hypothetical protein